MKDFKYMHESYQQIKRQSHKNLGSPGPGSCHKRHQSSAQAEGGRAVTRSRQAAG